MSFLYSTRVVRKTNEVPPKLVEKKTRFYQKSSHQKASSTTSINSAESTQEEEKKEEPIASITPSSDPVLSFGRNLRTQSCHTELKSSSDAICSGKKDEKSNSVWNMWSSNHLKNVQESGPVVPPLTILNPYALGMRESEHLKSSWFWIVQAIDTAVYPSSYMEDKSDGKGDREYNLEALSREQDEAWEKDISQKGIDTWEPIPHLVHSKESLAFDILLQHVMDRVLEETTLGELEIRANTPEYKVLKEDWVAHSEKNQRALITPLKAVARLPASLIIHSDCDQIETEGAKACQKGTEVTISGYLRKRGETNKSFRRRYMELKGNVLSYYKKKPSLKSREENKTYLRGSIHLESVTSLQPLESKTEKYGVVLVTTSRTWELVVENEIEYHRWLKELCNAVEFYAVHITYKRMFQLQEVSAKAITDVRMVIATDDTVQEIVEHIFNCYKQALDAAPLKPYIPEEYVLKITGYRDYLIDPNGSMNQYMHVRECLLTKKTIRLTVIHKSVISEIATRSASISSRIGLIQRSMEARSKCAIYARSRQQHSNSLTEEPSIMAVDQDRKDEGVLPQPIPSASIREPLRVCIHRLLNIPRTICHRKRTSEHSSVEQKILSATSVFVRAEIYHGNYLLAKSRLDTLDVRLRSQDESHHYAEWMDPIWLEFDLQTCAIPRTARMIFTVYGVRKNAVVIDGLSTSPVHENNDLETDKILVTGVNIFEVDGFLVTGTRYVAMYPSIHTCLQGPVPHQVLPEDPMIHIELATIPGHVRFDWNENEPDFTQLVDRSSQAATRPSMLRKEGWLHKLGYSRWTRWRRRWFIVDQQTCTLNYADDPKSIVREIPLKNCQVCVADDMNEKYTTAPVNKGTRKERHTYCFKIRPEKSSREYFISAETKQEREEWMLAILTVSKYDPASLKATMIGDTLDSDVYKSEQAEQMEAGNLQVVVNRGSDERNAEDLSQKPLVITESDPQYGQHILASFARELRRDSIAISESFSQVNPDSIVNELQRVILLDPLYRLSPYQKAQMWCHREEFMDIPAALPRILSCVNWEKKKEVDEALQLLHSWAIPDHKAAYIEFLDKEFAHEGVRFFAVRKIAEMADTTLSYFLPQLVQAIKFENHHVSPIAALLIERAIRNPNQIGFDLFWSMKVESHHVQYRERYGVLLNGYLNVCSSKMRGILKLQDQLFSADGTFDKICQQIKAKKKEGAEEMKRVMRQELTALNEHFSGPFQLPIDPRIEVGRIIVSKCRVMDSAKKPLWLVFENAEQGGDPITIMFKSGDDVRQDCLTLQLIRLMDEMWRDEGLDLAMEPYRCVATSPMTGILQVVPNSVTTADIHKRVGILGAFKDPSFSEWIQANNPDRRSHKAAVDLFRRSCAGYCVATCVLGIGDRHNDNIMV